MARLDKLAIRGVRSFDDKGLSIIQFFTPLTVIVGYNGSGKTTIIEALKYATTGDMPPNTKGGAFIHDPKIASSNEVKAQVRLRFYAADKTRFNCVRNVQVTVKKGGGLTMKTLEGLLQIDDPEKAKNRRAIISTKCADLDEEIPRLLGVSKAILENVIFCHQEESNWPLSEASVLKKKFDEIFDATRYTKALENIKVMRRERNNDLKVNKAELDALKIDRDRSQVLAQKRESLEKNLETKQARLDELDEEIRRITKQNKQFYDSAVKFREIVNLAETLEEKRKLHHENREALRKSMTEIEEPDDELHKRRDSFQDHLTRLQRRRNDLVARIEAKKEETRQAEERYSQRLSERGALENDKTRHQNAIAQRETDIRRISIEVGLRGFDVSGLSNGQIEDFRDRLSESSKAAETALKSHKAESASRDTDLSNRHQELRSERSTQVATRENSLHACQRLKDRIKQVQDELDGVMMTESDLDTARERHEGDVQKVQKLRAEIDAAKYDEELRKKNNDIRELDDRREEFTAELNTLNRHAEMRVRVDLKKKERTDKLASAESLVQRHSVRLSALIAAEVRLDTVEDELRKTSASNTEQLAFAERDENEKCRAVQHLESALSISRTHLSEKKARLVSLEREIASFLEREGDSATSIAQTIQSAEREIETLTEELTSGAHAYDFFNRIMTTGKSRHSCIGCGRSIKDEEQAAFERYVSGKIKQLTPEGRRELETTVGEWKDVLTQARALLPREDSARTMKSKEIPELEREIEKQTAELTAKSTLAEEASARLRTVKERSEELMSLKRVAQDSSRMLNEAEALRSEISALEQDLVSTGSLQTGDEVQNAINDMADNIKRLKREAVTIERSREAKRNELNNAERAAFRSEKTVSEHEQENKRRIALVKRVDELKREYDEASEQLKKLDKTIDDLVAPIKKAKDELEQFRSRGLREEQRLSDALAALQSKVKLLEEGEERIREYVANRGAQKLQDCIARIGDLQGQMASIQEESKEIESDVAKIDKDLNESNAVERNIHDNIRYRELGADLEKIDDELGRLDLDEASTARQEFEDKYHNQKQLENTLNGEAQHLSGEIASLTEQIKARVDELKNDYKDIHARFSKKLVEAKTAEIVNADLERYAKALEQAIIRFHGLKMQEINEQIRYLWAKTYQGSDIDSISIESDTEKVGNRSYNYRVCMTKDSVKMDMRGRCSAGQKVLASIIIRLALADSFATNCRFMALDEPTLCLDHETVGALARSLADIIRERPSTQLIVVTHDQDFLSLLATHTSVDMYWRVGRDELQKSFIERSRVR
ncbi:unnamed protein product [Parajaminaea phylloscopi]